VGSLGAFREALAAALASGRTTILEVRSDRRANRELHRLVNDAVR
jgi:2-succinyl-5-enolpyruvyl-6-hydroxy-3-cyclohexene-1-carboxylate synthase